MRLNIASHRCVAEVEYPIAAVPVACDPQNACIAQPRRGHLHGRWLYQLRNVPALTSGNALTQASARLAWVYG